MQNPSPTSHLPLRAHSETRQGRRVIVEFAFEHEAPTHGAKAKPLSDHAWLVFSRRLPTLELRGAPRPRPALPRVDEKAKTAFRDRVRQGDIHEGICTARNASVHATTEAARLLREAAVQVVAESRRVRAEQPLQTAHLWRRWLQEAYSARHAGLSPHEMSGTLLNARMALDEARCLVHQYGNAIGISVIALPFFPIAASFTDDPACNISNPLCPRSQAIPASGERRRIPHHLEYETHVRSLFLQSLPEPLHLDTGGFASLTRFCMELTCVPESDREDILSCVAPA